MTLCGYLVMTIGKRNHYSTTLIPTANGTIPKNALSWLLFFILTVFELRVDNKICGHHPLNYSVTLEKAVEPFHSYLMGPRTHYNIGHA